MDKKLTYQQLEQQLSKVHVINARYRGEVINHVVNTETHLEIIISRYFTNGDKKKGKELRHCLLSNNMFSSNNKKNLFLFIAKTKFPKCKISGKDLDRIINLRNQMAHGKMIFSKPYNEVLNFDDSTITLQEWKTHKNSIHLKEIKLTKEFIAKEIEHIVSVNVKLVELAKQIQNDKE